ncbi:CRISPR-associated protein Cas4/endonuclease Cas1 fusion [Sedimentisphaera cyanobacteriorum]|uniref:CRISPR-associated endonuclease Cas1 n=1 Tax=Sedimentisphaera cyanobacteriorum TaxID=1940790 RepID=A0A1Q2HT27_9BACT|nr:type V CRISPR-associated endonuclease Cas1 [Sedimentisphaera cyanobacteriorum]AQQ10485.1 CRISPR-associated protein Cas4/endonuclease Cas1 fusion [Sedimentisphaera cyanobacteriorum]
MLTLPDFKEKQIIFAMLRSGEKLSFKNDNVIIKNKEGQIKHQSTCYRLFALFIAGHTTLTSGLVARAEKFGFSIVLMNHSLRVYQVLSSPAEGNVLLRKKQYSYNGLELAKQIVENKISNQISAIKTIRSADEKKQKTVQDLKELKEQIKTTSENQSLLGIEGAAARSYFSAVFSHIEWKARRPRVKQDPANCLLDIGYTYLFNVIEGMLCLYGFDLYQGVYHKQFYQRKSLVCDLVEPFRPIIDLRIRKAFSLGQVKIDDFTVRNYQYRIFGKAAVPYSLWLIETVLGRKEEMFKYVQSYYRAFMRDKKAEEFPTFEL